MTVPDSVDLRRDGADAGQAMKIDHGAVAVQERMRMSTGNVRPADDVAGIVQVTGIASPSAERAEELEGPVVNERLVVGPVMARNRRPRRRR